MTAKPDSKWEVFTCQNCKNESTNPDTCPRCGFEQLPGFLTASEAVHMTKPLQPSLEDEKTRLEAMTCDYRALQEEVQELRSAVRLALWIRDVLEQKGTYGSDFEEWREIEQSLKDQP